jgi:peptidyl-prolyl cis-trans isomerase SurA
MGTSIGMAELIDGIAAVVNEDIITFTDVRNVSGPTEEALRKAYAPRDPELIEKLRETKKAALDQLIERRLIIQQFNSKGGKVPDTYVEEEIKATIDEQYGRDRTVFINTLESLGLNLETFKDRVRDQIIVRYMRKSQINDEILVSPYKIEKYYKEHGDEFKEGEKVKLLMLYIKKGTNKEEIDGARSLVKEILLKLTTGSEFRSIAAVYSEGSEKKNGGDLGFISKDTLREELREAAFKLSAGQISPVIETKDGFYILQVEEKKQAKVATLEESRDMIERLLVQEERERLHKRWLQTLRRNAYVRLY